MAAAQPIYSDHARLLRLRRHLTWLAATVAIVIAVAVPVIYLLTAYKYETLRIERTAQGLAETVSGFIYSHPDLWEFSTNRLDKPDGLPTSPQAQRQQQDVINRVLAA